MEDRLNLDERSTNVDKHGSILGRRVRRTEDPKLLTGSGTYVGDLRLDTALYVTYIRYSIAHAKIAALTSRMPGKAQEYSM